MNYLAHLHLGGAHPQQMLGSLYGDFVKGALAGRFPAPLETAIRLHRSIDAFTDSHPLVLQAMARFPLARRRYAGILVDVFFDHCLARDWPAYADEPLECFTARAYRALEAEPQLPPRLASIVPHMIANDWLGSYRDFRVLDTVFKGIATRLSRPEGLAGSFAEVSALYEPLSGDFRAFYPQLQTFVRTWR